MPFLHLCDDPLAMAGAPLVRDHMSSTCHAVEASDPITQAKELMQFHAIRHLPVLEGAEVVGMVSLGDLYAMEAVLEVDPDRTEVRQAMSADIFTARPDTPLLEVVRTMADRHIGSTVVLGPDGGLAGVFTATDCCRVLAELLAAS